MATVAWFGSISTMEPDDIRRLRDVIGLTAIIPDDYMSHHSGFRMPEDLLARSPLATWHEQPTLDQHRKTYGLASNASPVFPGVVGPAFDDSRLLRLIDEADKLGVEVWAHLGLWGYGGDIFPDLALRDVHDNTTADEYAYWGVPICPNDTEVRDWTAECLQYIAKNYGVKAIDVDHGHYPPPASIPSLTGCSCPQCEATAQTLGFDFSAMKAALSELEQRVASLTLPQFEQSAELANGFLDFLRLLAGNDPRLLDWFRFRCQVATDHMQFLTQAVHDAVGDSCPVDSHLFPPAIAYLSGQDLPSWEKAVDRLTAGWGDVVGWSESQTLSFAAWADKLCKNIDGLDEKTALGAIYRFFGYDSVGLPYTIAELKSGNIPRGDILSLEIKKAASLFSGDTPFLPPYPMRDLNSDERLRLGEVIKSVGAAGFVMSGHPKTMSDDDLKLMLVAL